MDPESVVRVLEAFVNAQTKIMCTLAFLFVAVFYVACAVSRGEKL